MNSKRLCCLLIIVGVALILSVLAVAPPAVAQNSTPESAASIQRPAMIQYSLPPDKLQKSYALYLIGGVLYFVTTVWGLLVLYATLRLRFGARLRDLALRASRFRVVQAAIVMSLFFLVLQVVQLPLDAYGHHIGLQYGLSVQHWGSWFGDWAKNLALILLGGSIAGWGLYAALRGSPRRWWFYFWLGTIPFVVFVIFIQPIWIDPLFNKFEPLTGRHADLVADLERVVHRAGMAIPPERMFEMKASEKTTQLNAYVTGFGSTKRVVVWDTTMQHLDSPQTMFVFGHEMGHYVLGHIPKMLGIFLLMLLGLYYIGYRLAIWLVERFGEGWGIDGLSDWASLPLLFLLFSVLLFLANPVVNGISRHYQHQADQYGLEVMHGLVPDSGRSAAQSFQILGERSLDYPDVGKFAEFWLWSHPTIRDRVIYAQTYDPWSEGQSPEFVIDAK
jgi:Zn-dependent protease with chaperone function